DRGAGIDVPCIDHKTMPAQYALVERPEVCRRLLERGATPDIYMAARLGDAALATRLIDADPACVSARIHEPGYAPVPPLHIYCWTLGFGRSPHDIATREDHCRLAISIFFEHFVAAELMLMLGFDPAAPGIDGGTALHAACWIGNVRMVGRLLERGGVGLDARDSTHGSTPLGW